MMIIDEPENYFNRSNPDSRVIRPIRVETVLTRYPIHRLAKRDVTGPIEIRQENKYGELTIRWEISPNSRFGHPGPLAFKLDTLIVNRHIDHISRTMPEVPSLIRLGSLKQMAKELGQGGDTASVKKAFLQNASVFITARLGYKDKAGKEQVFESHFTRYEVHFAGELLPDGSKADAVYLFLNDSFRRHLNSARTRPLDYDYLKELNPVSHRWYELASFHVYGVLKHGGGPAQMRYGDFCQFAPQARCDRFGAMHKQMKRVLAPHVESGYVEKLEYSGFVDKLGKPDWTLSWMPGPKAIDEYKAANQGHRKGKATSIPGNLNPISGVREPRPNGLSEELIDLGVATPVAKDLVLNHSEDRIRKQIAALKLSLEDRRERIKNAAAYLVVAIKQDFAPPEGLVARASRREAQKLVDGKRAEVAHQRRAEEEIRALVDQYWNGMGDAKQRSYARKVLDESDPEIRDAYEKLTPSNLRRAFLARLCEEAIRVELKLPLPPGG